MRVLFVSDTHLGFDLPQRPRVERRRRGHDFFHMFELALQPAFAGEVDVVVHGGDLLYRSRVPASLADAALEPLMRVASRGIPVLLVPGNHERARMPYPLLALHDGLHVFDRPRTVVVEADGLRAAFIGFPYTWEVRHRFPDVLAEATQGAEAADVRVLCMHQAVENATCGPSNFVFRGGVDVVRTADLPDDAAVTLCGHIHRHQVLRPRGRGPVIYAGSVERTSFAEAPETKGYVLVDLTRSGLATFEFRPLPARPMLTRTVALDDCDGNEARERVKAAIESTPEDAVVQLRVTGVRGSEDPRHIRREDPRQIGSRDPRHVAASALTAGTLRAIAGRRNVTIASRA